MQNDKAVVKQSQLAELCRLREQERRCDQLRRELVELLESGAEIEQGPLTAFVEIQSQRRITSTKLAALVGAEQVELWKLEIEPTVSRMLRIKET